MLLAGPFDLWTRCISCPWILSKSPCLDKSRKSLHNSYNLSSGRRSLWGSPFVIMLIVVIWYSLCHLSRKMCFLRSDRSCKNILSRSRIRMSFTTNSGFPNFRHGFKRSHYRTRIRKENFTNVRRSRNLFPKICDTTSTFNAIIAFENQTREKRPADSFRDAVRVGNRNELLGKGFIQFRFCTNTSFAGR